MGKFEITRKKNDEFQFNLKATNGQVILNSEGYTTKAACMNGVESVMKNSADEKRFEEPPPPPPPSHFNLNATNGQIIGKSQMYTTEDTRKNGIESVMKNAPEATIDDQTL